MSEHPTPALSGTVRPQRRGRPRGGGGEQTRRAIIDVARRHFAERGFASASLPAIAADVGIATSALYHYFSGKEELYETVFHATAPAVWDRMSSSIQGADTMVEGVESLLHARGSEHVPHSSAFLVALPTVAVLHPEFRHLLDDRQKIQDEVFRTLAELGLRTGELAGFELDEATELLRSMIMGLLLERHYLGAERPGSIEGVLKALHLIAIRGRSSTTPDEGGS